MPLLLDAGTVEARETADGAGGSRLPAAPLVVLGTSAMLGRESALEGEHVRGDREKRRKGPRWMTSRGKVERSGRFRLA